MHDMVKKCKYKHDSQEKQSEHLEHTVRKIVFIMQIIDRMKQIIH